MIYISENHGCVYRIYQDVYSDVDYLIYTPLNQDNTFSMNDDDWIEVDEMALLGEEKEVQDYIEFVFDYLQEVSE